jgi:hypothetical protein
MCCRCQIGGYLATFDLRDPGTYTLQVIVGAFFGGTSPPETPLPITVGTHATEYTECNTVRSLANGGAAIGLELTQSDVPDGAKRFGASKCKGSDSPGRWINLDSVGGKCEPPYCVGPTDDTLFDYDWVRLRHDLD